ncbi:hypothetical protein G5I_02389 [Acromyrmex echinatior]|uniref:Uncharacterized protein n=1 Tax=Acromyrmex echinatior TaxID=103372 RepID=F4WA69_ACREC|nr:hypothetical protein G5I_02389 [Acromyrmex echinatior]
MVRTKSISEREKTAKLIANTRASIRKKHRALKTGIMENEIVLEKQLKSIIEPLKQIAGNTERGVTNETLEKSFKTTGRDTIVRALQDTQKDISNDVEKVRNNMEEVSKDVNALSTRVSNEIQRGITDQRQQMFNIIR